MTVAAPRPAVTAAQATHGALGFWASQRRLWRLTWLLLRKDLRITARSRDTFALVLLFAVLCVLLFAFGFLREGAMATDVLPGTLWVTLLFSTTVALLRLFAAEEEGGVLEQVGATAAGSAPLFFSKALMQLIFAGAVTALVLPLVALFYAAPLARMAPVLLALALGLTGQALVGTLIAALMVRIRLRELMLPLVLYPTVAPLLIAGVKVTAIALAGGDPAVISTWLGLMVVFDLVFVLASPWLHARAA